MRDSLLPLEYAVRILTALFEPDLSFGLITDSCIYPFNLLY